MASLERKQPSRIIIGLVESGRRHDGMRSDHHLGRTLAHSSQSSSTFERVCSASRNGVPQANFGTLFTHTTLFDTFEFFLRGGVGAILQGTRGWSKLQYRWFGQEQLEQKCRWESQLDASGSVFGRNHECRKCSNLTIWPSN